MCLNKLKIQPKIGSKMYIFNKDLEWAFHNTTTTPFPALVLGDAL